MDDCALAILGPDPDAEAYIGLLAERCGDDDDAAQALKAVWETLGIDLDAMLSSSDDAAPVASSALPPADSTTHAEGEGFVLRPARAADRSPWEQAAEELAFTGEPVRIEDAA
jgi:ribosomal protein S12 methylthiotransferase accessory factor YcaO